MSFSKTSPLARRSRRRKLLLPLVALLALVGVLLYGKAQLSGPQSGTSSQEGATVPVVRVETGEIEQTLRLTGVTAAESYADLVAPQMRGGRRGSRGLGSISTGASRSSGGSSSAASAAISSSSSSAAAQSSSSLSAPPSSSAAFRAATSRFSSPTSSSGGSSSSSSRSSSSSGTSSTSSALGSSGLGSTSQGIPGGGGGGGGGGRGFRSSLVLKELAEPGSRVEKGDIVAEFDREDMLVRLDDYRASVAQAEASMSSIEAQLEVIRKAHEQSIQVSQAELDKARLDLKTIPVRSAIVSELLRLAAEEAEARHNQLLNEVKLMDASLKAQMRIATLNLQDAKSELKRVEAHVDKMLIRTPIDGIIVMRSTWRGGEQGQIEKGDDLRSGQPFMQIVDTDSMVVNASINQVDSEMIRIGTKARVRFDAYPDLELPATVFAIGAITKAAGWRAAFVKEIPVTLKLQRTDPRVIPDLSVSVDLVLGAEKQVVVAPLESIFRDGPDARPFVFVRGPGGWERREVELGLSSYITAAVRSGLTPGELIARQRPSSGTQKEK